MVGTVMTLEELKERAKQNVNHVRDERMVSGFHYAGHTFDSDAASQTNIIGVVTGISVGMTLPEGFTWRTTDDQNVPANVEYIVNMASVLLAFKTQCYQVSWWHKAVIDSYTTAEEVESHDLTLYWPEQ